VRDERKRKADDAGVGKYLGKATVKAPTSAPLEYQGDKKKRKAGGFGDFSAW